MAHIDLLLSPDSLKNKNTEFNEEALESPYHTPIFAAIMTKKFQTVYTVKTASRTQIYSAIPAGEIRYAVADAAIFLFLFFRFSVPY